MRNDEVKELQVGDFVDYWNRWGIIIPDAEVLENSSTTIFGTPVVVVEALVREKQSFGYKKIIRAIKPKQILRKV